MKPIEKNNLNSDSAFLVHIVHVSAQFRTIKTTFIYRTISKSKLACYGPMSDNVLTSASSP